MLDKLKMENAEKKKALDEKNLLFREINHRVKNNFQLVSSIIGIEKNKISDENELTCLNELQNRIRIMAQIHERLQQTDDITTIEFGSFINLTVNNMAAIYTNNNEIKMKVDTDDIQLEVKQAVSLGLILTELLTNAFKYAFKDDEKDDKEISVIFKRIDNDLIKFVVADNGQGIKYDINNIPQKSLGLQIIKNLTEIHLDGNLDIERKNGTKFIITFKSEG
jgi:two-component sensor histidine kinase